MLRLLVGTRFQVLFHSPPGVLFTFPSRYWSTIGHRRVFRVGGWTPQLPTGFHVSGSTRAPRGSLRGFAYGALTLFRRPSQAVPLPRRFVTARCAAPQPRRRFRHRRFALGPRSLATTRGISFDFSSSGYLDVSVPPVTSARPMCSAWSDGKWLPPGLPIRRSTGQRVSAPHRGLSQLVTSFVGFLCQGIHRVPLPSSSRWFGITHTPGRSRARRSDAIFFKEEIRFVNVTLCSSQGTPRAGPQDRTLRATRGAAKRRLQREPTGYSATRERMSLLSRGGDSP